MATAKKKPTSPIDTTSFVEPSVRTFIEWTPDTYRAARLSADSGNLSLIADFCEAAMGDERVGSALDTLTGGLIGLPIKFEPARGRKKPVKALEADADWWTAFPETETKKLLMWGVLLGVGFGKLTWITDEETGRVIPVLETWHARHFEWSWDDRCWYVKLAGNRRERVDGGDGTWVVFTPYGASRPWAWGKWRAIALWQLLKQFAQQDWARYSERHGSGLTVAETPENWSKEKRKEIARDLFDLSSNASIALPAGVKLSLLEAMADTYKTFVDQINMANMGEAVAILGQNLSTEVSGPVSTGATLHGKVMFSVIRGLEASSTTCFHDQVIVWWAEFNFGNRALAPWARFDITPPEDKQAEATRISALATAVKTFGDSSAPVDVRTLLEAQGIPLKDPKDGDEDSLGTLFQYHFTFGIITINEARKRLGLPAIAGGDVPPTPIAVPKAGDGEGDSSADEASKAAMRAWDAMLAEHQAKAAKPTKPGQAFVDGLAKHAAGAAAADLKADVDAVVEAVRNGTTADDIRARVVAAFKGMRPGALARTAHEAAQLANLAGRVALKEETTR